ncbi:MAG: MerR family transcriptional regulator [Acidimicrobiia bacterium]|nr:MAG: MerR family transcriptional regulator [Acidimicrobiia bacterium]
MAARAEHVSIGDVLNQLREEFPDITISKIRFLESQGLVEPERTPSGYRKFFPADVERLRFILRQQKDHFLPLKVIKDRLDEIDRAGGFAAVAGAQAGEGTGAPPGVPADAPGTGTSRGGARRRARRAPKAEPALFEEARIAREREAAAADAVRDADDEPQALAGATSGVSLTRAELARAADLGDEEVALLEEYGLIQPAYSSRERVLFDEDALEIARVAGGFMRHGVEPRHLRMYRAFADREAGLFEQVLLPYRRRRNPEAQARYEQTLAELARLGRQLRTALLRSTVRRSLGG